MQRGEKEKGAGELPSGHRGPSAPGAADRLGSGSAGAAAPAQEPRERASGEAPSASPERVSSQLSSLSLPKGGGAIRGMGEKFTSNPVTGTGTLTVPIPVSPGRSGFDPHLTLSYDSGSGNGPFGLGWSLSVPAISRKTEKGLPRYADADETDVYILSEGEDLVPVLRDDGKRFEDDTTFPDYVIHRYRPRVEEDFARIERWTKRSTGEIHWRSITRDNITTLYGEDYDSRVFDPSDPDPAHPTRVFRWLACASWDDKGDAIVYDYVAEDDARVDLSEANERNRVRTANRYLKRVRYGNRVSRLIEPDLRKLDWLFEVVFDYDEGHCEDLPLDPNRPEAEQHRLVLASAEPGRAWALRPDPFSTHRPGFELRTYRRCLRVLVFHRFPELGSRPYLVRATRFDYADLDYSQPVAIDAELAHQGSTRLASFLRSMTQSGFVRDETLPVVVRDGIPYDTYLERSLPPLELEYTKAHIVDEIHDVDESTLENLPVGIDGSRYRLVDLDGEGLSGILTEQAGAWHYKPNLGEGHFGPLETLPIEPSLTGKAGGDEELLDLSGDGQLDVVSLDGPAPGFYERTLDERWEPFRAFRQLPNVDWDDHNLRFVDLDGDGHADILITEQDVFTWHPSLAEEGFGPARQVRLPSDEERGPRLVLADRAQSIYLADMSGDGLTDLVRVRNGEVSYWPNQGHGRFGAKVTMDHAPRFDRPDQFDQRRVRITDIDGSGTADIIYLGRDGARLYFNQSGNRWSEARPLPQFPPVDNLASVITADLLGNGTACLVWSSPLPAAARRSLRYIDLMGGQKPHLLNRAVNNLGAETRVEYAPSTRFYLADKLAGKPWITRLPFPVHVVVRVETYDHISRNRFVTRHAYHHGYFDGVEREFRGFGLVEQWDTEELAALRGGDDAPPVDNIDAASYVPPVLTKTWYHTGVHLGREHVSDFFAGLLDDRDTGEYYREPGGTDAEARDLLLEDSVLPTDLTIEEEREACRALKGTMLRREVYSLDGTAREEHPYDIVEQNLALRTLQRRGDNRHAVFFAHARESLSYHYERTLFPLLAGKIVDEATAAANPATQRLPDPRVTHTLTLEVDQHGNVLRSAVIGYGRRYEDLRIPSQPDRDEQRRTRITYTENQFTKPVEEANDHRTPLPSESRTYELTGLPLLAPRERYGFTQIADAGSTATPLDYEQTPHAGSVEKRLIEHTRTIYRRDDLSGPLALHDLEALALPFESYRMSLTADLVSQVYGGRVSDPMLESEGRYFKDGKTWWMPSGRVFYSPLAADTPAQELAYARQHFFLPLRHRDPFHTALVSTESFVTYDPHDVLVQETLDALGNRVTAGERDVDPTKPLVRQGQDYRVLQPALVMDPNRNRTVAAFDALGMVAGVAVMGKPEDVPSPGDRLTSNFRADLTRAEIDQFFADPRGPTATALLDEATTRIVYDPTAWWREPDPTKKPPTFAATLARETHSSEPVPAGGLRIQCSFSYSDGFGREIQQKLQAEAGPVPERGGAGKVILDADGQPEMTPDDRSPRWVGSGWTVFNNKGKPVRKYEPYFTDTHHFEFDVRVGVSQVLFYDPTERVVATLVPDHTWEKVVFDPWRQETWDRSDTVLIADPSADADVGDFFQRLPVADYLPTWYARRQSGALGPEEQTAALKAAVHARTPTIRHADALARTFLTIVHNRFKYSNTPPGDPPVEELQPTRVLRDIEGNPREVTDPRDRVAVRYDYDMLGNRIHQASMDAGERWVLGDVAGNPLYTWDDRDHRRRWVYDPLRRPTGTFLREGVAAELLVEHTVHGETQPSPEAKNLRGNVVQVFDQAGVVTTDEYDFKGNPLFHRRRLAQSYKTTLSWSAAVPLEAETYTSSTRYDALNRPVELTSPDSSVIRHAYNEANLLERVDVNLRGALLNGAPVWTPFIADIDYDAKGQRTLIDHGNGVRTTYDYDPRTFRLVHIVTRRDEAKFPGDCPEPPLPGWPGCRVQNLQYTYDAIGNITHVRDSAQQIVYFAHTRVEPSAEYTYDAVRRLIEATGREHLGQIGGSPIPNSYDDAGRVHLPHRNDGRALGRYLERYVYDAVGNILSMQHRGSNPVNPGWTRDYTYDEPSLLQAGKKSNRLTRTTVGGASEIYSTAGDGYDAHGNMLRMPQLAVMEWNHEDQLRMTRRQAVNASDAEGTARQGERTYYVYDSEGQRVRKVTELGSGKIKDERIYLGGFEIYKRHGAHPLVRETLHVMDDQQRVALVETRTQGTEPGVPAVLIRYQSGNHLGSATLELDDKALIVSYEEYTPFGSSSYQAVRSQTETPKRYRYTGKERDEESGLYYHGARYHAPWLGRWTSADPLLQGDFVEQELDYDPYAYAGNNPVILVDPDGHLAFLAVAIIAAGAFLYASITAPGVANAPTSATDPTYPGPSSGEVLNATIDGAILTKSLIGGGGGSRQPPKEPPPKQLPPGPPAPKQLPPGPPPPKQLPPGPPAPKQLPPGPPAPKQLPPGPPAPKQLPPGPPAPKQLPPGPPAPKQLPPGPPAPKQLPPGSGAAPKPVPPGRAPAGPGPKAPGPNKPPAAPPKPLTPREIASKRGGELVKKLKREDKVGTNAGRSSGHGTPHQRAGAELIREANKLPKNDPMREALKIEGNRLIKQGGGINH